MGGKAANQKQTQLRSELLAAGTWEVDLSNSTFDWRAMLKSMPTGPAIIGDGVTECTFRRLQNERDHNYIKIDSGERHVFELTRIDGSVVRLHFHKNGKCDPHVPERSKRMNTGAAEPGASSGSSASAWPADSSQQSLRPPATYEDIINASTATEKAPPLGRNEARMALDALLQAKVADGYPIAIGIIDEVAFPWKRFLRNIVRNKGIIGEGVSRAYVVGVTEPPLMNIASGPYKIAAFLLGRADSSYVLLRPELRQTREEYGPNWHSLPVLGDAVRIGTSWMRLRQGSVARSST